MNTLDQALDDLDRMVDTGAEVPKLRNQISFIRGEVAALQQGYLEAIHYNAETVAENANLKAELAEIDAKAKGGESERRKDARRNFDAKVAAWNRAKTEKRHR